MSRWARVLLLSTLLAGACASANQQPADASVDLTVGKCDPHGVFAACTDQCHMPICIVASATCMGTQWVCDCNQTTPCRDMSPAD